MNFLGSANLSARHLASLEAARADVGLAHMTAGILYGDLLDVGAEGAGGLDLRVADVATSAGVLTANFTYLGHLLTPCITSNGF